VSRPLPAQPQPVPSALPIPPPYPVSAADNNEKLPVVAQSVALDIASRAPLQLSVRCQSKDKNGNANPFCPQGVGLAPPLGFQFVPNLAANPCSLSIPTLNAIGSQFAQSFPWLRDIASPAVAWAEGAMGIPAADIGASISDAFQVSLAERMMMHHFTFALVAMPLPCRRVPACDLLAGWCLLVLRLLQLMYFNDLAADLLIDTSAVWEHSGAPMAATQDASPVGSRRRCVAAAGIALLHRSLSPWPTLQQRRCRSCWSSLDAGTSALRCRRFGTRAPTNWTLLHGHAFLAAHAQTCCARTRTPEILLLRHRRRLLRSLRRS